MEITVQVTSPATVSTTVRRSHYDDASHRTGGPPSLPPLLLHAEPHVSADVTGSTDLPCKLTRHTLYETGRCDEHSPNREQAEYTARLIQQTLGIAACEVWAPLCAVTVPAM